MSRTLVGVLHLPPLPGSPRAALAMRDVTAACARDARALSEAGYDAVIVENFGDTPFFAGAVPAVTVSAMTACVLAVREACPSLRIGVNVLRNDALAALSIAAVTGAAFVRVNVLSGARVTDQGIIEGRAAELMRARRELGAAVEVWADVDVKHSAALAPRSIEAETSDVAHRALADAILVTGEGTGRPVDAAKLGKVRGAAGGLPLLVASGATIEQLPALAPYADGVIVGSALRVDGVAGGAVDPARAAAFARAFRAAFA